ncbi:MAG: hypothetical protein IH623_05140 [Verrucomicrobia bacterium]|nr:hypothetical protein [Verrucomicrobiota bacterium]
MNFSSATAGRFDLRTLLQGQADKLLLWTKPGESRTIVFNVAVILLGAGLYGAAMGWWREPLQGFYVAIKFPLVILLTTLGNALLNAMLAPLLGLNISFRQSLLAILMSFTITAAVLGAFSPLAAFVVWNAPPMTPDVKSTLTYGFIKLLHVAVIAFAGIVGTVRLFQLLTQLGGSKTVARRVLFAWLAGNLFLGSQLTWIARPFIGAPHLPVVLLRDTALQGNFYENVFATLKQLLGIN